MKSASIPIHTASADESQTMQQRSYITFRFPHFTRVEKKHNQHNEVTEQQSGREYGFLTSQLYAANKENSVLRKQIADLRDSNVQQIHSLRLQKSSQDARITALSEANETLKAELESSTKQKQIETAALRAETESLRRQFADSEQKQDIIKSAVKELTQELTSIRTLHATTEQELGVVRREREAALDDACTVQNLLEQERMEHECKEYALQKEIMDLRRELCLSRDAKKGASATPISGKKRQEKLFKELQDENGDVANPLTTESISTEVLTPRSKYHILFSPQIPMTPIRALDDSDYVVKGHGFDSVREPAFAAVQYGRATMDFRMVLNEPFSAWGSSERPTMMYIGFEYPDGTSLCYVPLKDVRVKHAALRDLTENTCRDHGLGAEYGRDYVQLCIREEVYFALVEQAKDVFITRYCTEKVELPRVSSEKWSEIGWRMISLTASMKPDARVERRVNSLKQKTLVSKELLDKREDIVGDALLALRFSKAYSNESGYMLGFKLHGMFVGTR